MPKPYLFYCNLCNRQPSNLPCALPLQPASPMFSNAFWDPSHRLLDAKVLLPDEELLHPTVGHKAKVVSSSGMFERAKIHSDPCQCDNVIPGYTICPPYAHHGSKMKPPRSPSQCPWLILALQIFFWSQARFLLIDFQNPRLALGKFLLTGNSWCLWDAVTPKRCWMSVIATMKSNEIKWQIHKRIFTDFQTTGIMKHSTLKEISPVASSYSSSPSNNWHMASVNWWTTKTRSSFGRLLSETHHLCKLDKINHQVRGLASQRWQLLCSPAISRPYPPGKPPRGIDWGFMSNNQDALAHLEHGCDVILGSQGHGHQVILAQPELNDDMSFRT